MFKLHHVIVLSLLGCACEASPTSQRRHAAELDPSTPSAEELPPILAPYPRSTWRIGDVTESGQVMQWVSHILIRYDRAYLTEVSFNLHDWYSVLPPPGRTRNEALRLARDVAEKARLSPSSFAELAREYSEDITTREAGGSMGGVLIDDFAQWPQVIDALVAIKPGEASEVVETWYGFHIFQRAVPPPEQRVSGSHIVIGHYQGGWLRFVGTDGASIRSRTAAHQLAMDVYASAKRDPGAFEQLVEQYSEHRTKTQGGDIGSWSTHEPAGMAREAEVLSKLAVGDVALPIDTPWGFEILKRTPNRERQRYAANGIWLAFDPDASDDAPNSKAAVHEKATAIANSVAGDAIRLARVQEEVCCTFKPQWDEGQETPALTAILKPLAIGEVARTPVQSDFYWVVAQRVEPTPPAPRHPRFEVPIPDLIDLEFQVTALSADVAAAELRAVATKALTQLALSGDVAAQLMALQDSRGRFDDMKLQEANREVFRSFLLAVKQLLGNTGYEAYLGVAREHFTQYVMDPANAHVIERWHG